jgi:anaerobic magnesium-protoporphyrin IX monomethyl ester cyclase
MNILFVYSLDHVRPLPNKPLGTIETIQFGISYLSSLLRQHGHDTRLMVLSRAFGGQTRDTIDEYLRAFYPQMICFTAVATQYAFIVSIAKYIRTVYPDIYLVIGGPHVSLTPVDVLSNGFDALCVGEGETAIVDLASQLQHSTDPSGIPNLWIKHGHEEERNKTLQSLQDLDSLPFPDRHIWMEWIDERAFADKQTRFSVLLGRGCPFQCTYCSNHALSKLAVGPYVRFRSSENIVQEIRENHERWPSVGEVYLEVETFGVNQEWAIELCDKLEELNATLSRPLAYGVNLRVSHNRDYARLFEALRRSNFRFVNIGLESGSERIRREVLRRNYSNSDIINAVRAARRCGLEVSFLNLIGVPGETISDFRETVRINRACAPDWHGTSIFYPYPGTELHEVCRKQGLIRDGIETELERTTAVLDLPGFSKRQIQRSYVWFDYLVYRGSRPMRRVLLRNVASDVESMPCFGSLFRALHRLYSALRRHVLVSS